jgi:hypothetical protein
MRGSDVQLQPTAGDQHLVALQPHDVHAHADPQRPQICSLQPRQQAGLVECPLHAALHAARLSDIAVPASSRRSTRSRTNCDAGLGKALCMLAGCCAAAPPCGAAGPRSPAAPACRFSGCPGPGTLSTSTCDRTQAAARRDCEGGALGGKRAAARGCCQAVRQAPGAGRCRRRQAGGRAWSCVTIILIASRLTTKAFSRTRMPAWYALATCAAAAG